MLNQSWNAAWFPLCGVHLRLGKRFGTLLGTLSIPGPTPPCCQSHLRFLCVCPQPGCGDIHLQPWRPREGHGAPKPPRCVHAGWGLLSQGVLGEGPPF